MARVVLMWNEHPTEVVAGYHARKVAKILREKYGHEVILHKIPASRTNYGIVRSIKRGKTIEQALRELEGLPSSIEIAKRVGGQHGAPAFNFHASRVEKMGKARSKEPSEFEIQNINQRRPLIGDFEKELAFITRGGRHYAVEVPGEFNVELKERTAGAGPAQLRSKAELEEIERKTWERNNPEVPSSAFWELKDEYHSRAQSIRKEPNAKYISPIISEKLAEAIHRKLTERRRMEDKRRGN